MDRRDPPASRCVGLARSAAHSATYPNRLLADLFHEKLAVETIDALHAVIAIAHWHRFLVLTKRAERMRAYYTDPQTPYRIAVAIDFLRQRRLYRAWGRIRGLAERALSRRRGLPARGAPARGSFGRSGCPGSSVSPPTRRAASRARSGSTRGHCPICGRAFRSRIRSGSAVSGICCKCRRHNAGHALNRCSARFAPMPCPSARVMSTRSLAAAIGSTVGAAGCRSPGRRGGRSIGSSAAAKSAPARDRRIPIGCADCAMAV